MFYVYEWFRKNDNFIFYVGKGTRNRYKVKNRNKKFNEFIEQHECDVRIVKEFQDESESFIYEEELINKYRKLDMCTCNLKYGGNGGVSEIWTDKMREKMSEENPMKDEIQRERMRLNNPMKNKDIAKLVGDKHKRPVVLNGVYYEGTIDASNSLSVSTNTILQWCKRGYDGNGNPCRYYDEEQKSYYSKKNIKVFVNDLIFNSVKEASEYLGVKPDSLKKAIRQNRPCKGYICKYDNQHPSHTNVK